MQTEDEFFKQLEQKFVAPILNTKIQSNLRKISQKAYDEAMLAVLKQFYTRNLFTKIAEGDFTIFKDLKHKHLEMLKEESDRLSTKSPFWFITINPRPDVSLPTLMSVVAKLLKKKAIISYSYVYEVRDKKEGKFTGLHCHLLINQSDKPYNFKRSCKSTVKNICDFNNPHILNFKNIPTEEIMQQKIEYMTGIKKSSKMKGVSHTIQYRKKNHILPIYDSNPPLPCRITVIKTNPLISFVDETEGTIDTINDEANDEQ